jgi:hypothetical protein
MSSGFQETTREDWQSLLSSTLPAFGHRNWIVVADAAYPEQCRSGIRTVVADAELMDVLEVVLAAIKKTRHVRPRIYTDLELTFVAEQDAPGISDLLTQLDKSLSRYRPQPVPHEEIIDRLDNVARTFSVLVIKTRTTIPYSSVFLELNCAYWNLDAEARLRSAIKDENEVAKSPETKS